ncbi:glycosyltransferase [Pyrococcus sp. ST04]|uniref:glycosyltransferase n=1 Tax=Pyrococcus sp. ST04 TaxID=1183377 RepID=UPI0002605A7D|nr:glycosyltransferase [Pyrococcus sp. ST04]AFK22062.1 hypothetical protein Py04_0460 [Pyrococcus sp. ST04]
MKILFVSWDIPSKHTGVGIPSYYLIKYLSKKHDVFLVSFKLTRKENRYEDLSKYCKDIIIVEHFLDDMHYLKRVIFALKNMFSPKPFVVELAYSQKMVEKVRSAINKINPDVIYVDSYAMLQYIPDEICCFKVLSPPDAEAEAAKNICKQERNLIKKLFFAIEYVKIKYYEIKNYKKVNLCIVKSDYDRKILKSYLTSVNIYAIPNGVDIEYFNPQVIHNTNLGAYYCNNYIIFFGDMSPTVNVQAVLFFYKKIFPLIRKKYPTIKFYIVGRNPSPEIRNLQKDPNVVVTGAVDDIRPYVACSAVVIAPMISGGGIKNKVLQAMAMGKPVVTTSIGVRGVRAEHLKEIIIADDPEEFANYILELFRNPKLRKKIGYRARKLVEIKYTWDKIGEKFETLLKSRINFDTRY